MAMLAGLIAASCTTGPTPPASFLPGTLAAPREINLIASDYAFVPSVVRVIPGETVLIHVVNGGLEPHEAVIGDGSVQLAWEEAEATTVGHPPGPTPVVSVPPGFAGVRAFVASGARADLLWSVPRDLPVTGVRAAETAASQGASPSAGQWLVGCHVPGHFAKGMLSAIEVVAPVRPLPS